EQGPAVVGVQVWDRASEREIAHLRGHADVIACLAFDPNGWTLATGSGDGTAKLWGVGTARARATLRGRAGRGRAPALPPRGRTLATGDHRAPETGRGGAVCLWDVASGKRRGKLRPDCTIGALAFSPDSRALAVGCSDRLVRLWEPAGAKEFVALPGHAPAEAWAVAFSPDGRTLAAAGGGHLVRLWDLSAARQRGVMKGHAAP